MNRRDFIKTSSVLPAVAAVGAIPWFSTSAFAAADGKWRVFEIKTKVEVLKPAGATRVWLPLPLVADTDYQKNLGSTWNIEGGSASTATDGKYGAELVFAEWPDAAKTPVVEVSSRFATRDRAVDLSKPGKVPKAERAELQKYLAATEFMPTDGIVRDTARDITKGVGGGDIDLPGLSKRVYNFTAYYENNGFEARISQRRRSDFIGEIGNFNGARSLRYVVGHEELHKVTTQADMIRAERHVQRGTRMAIGMGYDVHALMPAGEKQVIRLGGIDIANAHALHGHSDADVVLHAIVDALLGTLCEGDIGSHFSPSDERWKGADSAVFIEEARTRVAAHGGVIQHLDITIIGEQPKISPQRDAMRTSIAKLLGLPLSRVSLIPM